MQYSQLSTLRVGEFLGCGGRKRCGFSEGELEYRMNGREIKIAQLLAPRKGEGLAIGHVESVLAVERRQIWNGAGGMGGWCDVL